MKKRWLSWWVTLMNSEVPPDINLEWSKGLSHKSLTSQTSDKMKLYKCAFWGSCKQLSFDIKRNEKPVLSQDHTELFNSELWALTKHNSNCLHFFLSSPSAEGLLHTGPQTPEGLWNESIWQSVKGNDCHYPYNLGGLDNQFVYFRCWQVPASQGCLGWFSI